ncbi:MAG TPA: hypothetical protein VGM31_23010 [Puia sp.]
MTKQLVLAIAIAGSLMGFTGCTVDGYVESQPADVTYVRPAAPGADYVWVDGDWVWTGGAYNWHPGYWRHSRPGRVWVGGTWSHGTRGYRWNRGHWRH